MRATDDVDGVLITGVYGAGKSSVAAEIAEALERRGVSYGAVDLDWLTWFDVPGMDAEAATRVYLANVADVVRNYRALGVRHIVFAGAVRGRDELRALHAATAMPLGVVRLEVPLKEIARRLQSDPTTGRRDDLQVAARWLRDSVGAGIEDVSIANEGPIQSVATPSGSGGRPEPSVASAKGAGPSGSPDAGRLTFDGEPRSSAGVPPDATP